MGQGPSGATQTQQQVNLQASQQQLQFNQQLQSIFGQQFANQQGVLKFLQGTLQPIVQQAENGQGMSQGALNAMRTSATENIASSYNSAQQALNQEIAQRGGANTLPSGTTAQLNASLANQAAIQQGSTQNQITQYNQSLATSNLWNAVNGLNGVAAGFNPLGYAGTATSGAGAIAGLSGAQSSLQNAITQANANTFGGQFFKSLGGSLGDSIGSGFGFDPQAAFCWVAAAVFSEDLWSGVRTNKVRGWMYRHAPKWVLRLYARHGLWVSKRPALVAVLAPVFRWMLRRAEREA